MISVVTRQHSHREAVLCYRKLAPCRELLHKGGQREVHDVCIVGTMVNKKAHLGMK